MNMKKVQFLLTSIIIILLLYSFIPVYLFSGEKYHQYGNMENPYTKKLTDLETKANIQHENILTLKEILAGRESVVQDLSSNIEEQKKIIRDLQKRIETFEKKNSGVSCFNGSAKKNTTKGKIENLRIYKRLPSSSIYCYGTVRYNR
jgi:uncharacterized coiled-coil protein SlyX